MGAPLECRLSDPPATAALGRAVASLLRAGDAVLLEGELGAGKSTLARALLRAACRDPRMEVPSPSFTLVQLYDGFDADGATLALAHLDLWRLDGPGGGAGALRELGWDEAVEHGAVVVEWPDRLGGMAPVDALVVRIELEDPAGGDVVASGGFEDGTFDDGEAAVPRRAWLHGWGERMGALRRALEGDAG